MAFNLDLTDVKSGYDPLPNGTYDVVVDDCEEVESTTGKPMIKWTLKVLGGEYDGRKLFVNTVLTPEAMWKVKETLTAVQYPANLDGNFDFDPGVAIGLQARAVVTQRTWEGQVRNDVKRMIAMSGAGASMFGLPSSGGGGFAGGGTTMPGGSGLPNLNSDDDLPFLKD